MVSKYGVDGVLAMTQSIERVQVASVSSRRVLGAVGPLGGEGNADQPLRRALGSVHVVAIVVSAMVGAGIFIRPASMAQDVGSAQLLLLAWIAAGLISLAGALCYAELATSMPHAGGEYVYLREAHV